MTRKEIELDDLLETKYKEKVAEIEKLNVAIKNHEWHRESLCKDLKVINVLRDKLRSVSNE